MMISLVLLIAVHLQHILDLSRIVAAAAKLLCLTKLFEVKCVLNVEERSNGPPPPAGSSLIKLWINDEFDGPQVS